MVAGSQVLGYGSVEEESRCLVVIAQVGGHSYPIEGAPLVNAGVGDWIDGLAGCEEFQPLYEASGIVAVVKVGDVLEAVEECVTCGGLAGAGVGLEGRPGVGRG